MKVPLEAVGKNLADHPGGGLSPFSANDTSLFAEMNTTDVERISEEYQKGGGMLATRGANGWVQGQGFIVSSKATLDWPDIKIAIRTSVGIDGDEPQISFLYTNERPKSKGVLTLDTEKYKAGVRDDVQLALIDLQLLSHPDDIEVLVEGKILLRLLYLLSFFLLKLGVLRRKQK